MNIQVNIKEIRMSPRKMGLVAALVRGRYVTEALNILEHTPKRAARPISKAIASIKSNAINNNRMEESSLRLEQIQITAGSRIKRFRPAAMGRALPYQKKSSHIKIVVSGNEKPKKSSSSKTASKAIDAGDKKEQK